MDLNTITDIVVRSEADALSAFREGDAWLAGGTWLYSEPQPGLRRLIDLDAFGWTPLVIDGSGLTIAATCKIAALNALTVPAEWTAGHLITRCCNALLGSFKVWNMATVGGNMCLALPAGPMTSLAAALGGTCMILMPKGGERCLAAADFVTGDRQTALEPGELLRSIHLPSSALTQRAAFRQVSLTPKGRSGALLIGLRSDQGSFALTVTASTQRPVRLEFTTLPSREGLREAIITAIPQRLYHDDVHGRPDWRRHLTFTLAEDIRRELEDQPSA